jgi:predicted PhzF superfamily epimerase YddE/YHI9
VASSSLVRTLLSTVARRHTCAVKKRDFLQIDVFATQPGRGNPLGVVLDAEGFDTAGMQAIAAWLNLSETTFVLPPTHAGADYRLRIFTSRQELPFAGHPSGGTARAVLNRCLVTPHEGCLVQECAAGLLPVRVEGEGTQRRLHVRAPRGAERAADPTAVLASLRGVRVGALRPDLEAMTKATESTGATGVAVFARCVGSSYALVVRAFVPADRIPEDPVTGSANAAIAAWMHANDVLPAPRFISSQGRTVARQGTEPARDQSATVRGGPAALGVGSRPQP